MIVVADSSPLHYLILLEQTEVLHRLYEKVLIPDTVAAKLRAEASPRKVSQWKVLSRLEGTNFYVDQSLINSVFARWLEE
jgi:predicted nucleic acid-binding protein